MHLPTYQQYLIKTRSAQYNSDLQLKHTKQYYHMRTPDNIFISLCCAECGKSLDEEGKDGNVP